MNSTPSDQTFEGQIRAGGTANSLGEKLRLAREMRGLSLREISDQTRISRRYLEAIEADDYKQLPGGIFNRSFIKAYARAVGFNEAEALEAYTRTAREHGESPDEVPTTPYRSRVYTPGESNRSPWLTAFFSILILAVLTLGIYALLHWYRRAEKPLDRPNSAATAAKPGVNPPPAANQNVAQTTARPAATAPPVAGLQIHIQAKGEPVWIRAKADDGDSVETTLKPDESKDFAPQDHFSLKYSKSKATVLQVSINGRPATVPSETKGGIVEMLITKNDYQKYLQGQ